MKKINLRDVAEVEQRSPTGKFHSCSRNVSLALGGLRNTGTWGGGHPFDFQVRRLPRGAAICPHHAHLAQWELFVIRRGSGTVRAGKQRHAVRAGDCFIHPPGEAHQLINTGRTELEVFIFADNPPLDAFHYPDSGKWGLRPPGVFFEMVSVDYFDGEDPDPSAPAGVGRRFPPIKLPPPARSFRRRRVRLADLPWDSWRSPGGKYAQRGRDISGALGDVLRGWPAQGHPFNLELVKLPPGKAACPFHAHGAQWEMFIVIGGEGTVRSGRKRHAIGPGDVLLQAPGDAHQLINSGQRDLTFFVVADNPPVDIYHYPDSKKWGFPVPRKFFRDEITYFDGEE